MDRTIALLKPDAIERGLQGQVSQVVRTLHLEIKQRRVLHLCRRDVLKLDFDDYHRWAPVTFELSCSYLCRGPCEALLLYGHHAVERGLVAKALVRQQFGDSDIANLIHTASSTAEALHQAAVLFPGCAPPVGQRPRDVVSRRVVPIPETIVCWLTAQLASVAERPNKAIVEGRPDECGVVVHDDRLLGAEDLLHALMRPFPNRSDREHVTLFYQIKRFGERLVFTGSLGEAARIAITLNDAGVTVSLLPPAALREALPVPGATFC